MDLIKGFWQILTHPDDRKYFAFSTKTMHLEYIVAPMDSKNSPACLSALRKLLLRGLPPQHVISYRGDILCADSNMEDLLRHLDQILTALEKAGLKFNPVRCSSLCGPSGGGYQRQKRKGPYTEAEGKSEGNT
jgi:hypothetical protein